MSKAPVIFEACVQAIRDGALIEREGQKDKEFHFQNWFARRLDTLGLHYDSLGRNTYPDFCLVNSAEGFELKGLAYPGRSANYDCNSQIPRGEHNGRQIFYVFGRYPKEPDGDRYPVLDFVMCHGEFLNADNTYVHKNESFKGFGSYGDILVRDRKMYVAPTPFALVEGMVHQRTLIVPAGHAIDGPFVCVGELVRKEADQIVVAYQFDLRSNEISTATVPNPNAGKEHAFSVYRLQGDPTEPVSIQTAK